MKCRYCGEENPNGEKLCRYCGSLLLAGDTDVLSEAEKEAAAKRKYKRGKRIGVLVSVLLVLLLAAVFLPYFLRGIGKKKGPEGFYCIQAGDVLHLCRGADLLLSVEEPTDYSSVLTELSGDGSTAYVLVREKGKGDGHSLFVMNGKTASRIAENVHQITSVSYDGNMAVYLSFNWEYHRYDRKTGKDEVLSAKDGETYFFHPEGKTFVSYRFDQERKQWVSTVFSSDGTVTEYPGMKLYPAAPDGKTLFGYEELTDDFNKRFFGELVTVKNGNVTRLGKPGVAAARLRLNRDCTEMLFSAENGTWLVTADGNCRKLYDTYLRPLFEEEIADEVLPVSSFLDGNYLALKDNGAMQEALDTIAGQLRDLFGIGEDITVYPAPSVWGILDWAGEYLSASGLVHLKNGEAETVVSFGEEQAGMTDAAQNGDGTVLVWLDGAGMLHKRDFKTGKTETAENVNGFVLSPDGKKLYYTDGKNDLYRFGEDEPLTGNVRGCYLTETGLYILSGYYGKVCRVSDSGETTALLSDIARLETVGGTLIASTHPNAGDRFRDFYAMNNDGTFTLVGSGIRDPIPISESRTMNEEERDINVKKKIGALYGNDG
ncbi:MAG: zinc ribbon domain-containing protein [Lachnospiraceae bacterium]|nr:zinc ribbon domain-containing protein [Lachnospiraceae bacterium]